MEIKLTRWQTKVWNDNHRFRVVCSGRRSGKSTLAQLTLITWANENAGLYWIVAPTYVQAKQIHWEGIQHFIPRGLVAKKNEAELSIEFTNGAKIQLKSAENPDSLRGVKLRGLVIDEIASIRNWDWLWSEVLRATLTDYEAPAIFISTPKGYNHFFKLFELGQGTDEQYKSWRFTSYDNPYLPEGEIDNAKKELTEDTFAQEYLADFRKATGLAFKQWDRSVHLITAFDIPNEWRRGRGFDYGSNDPTASLRVAIDNDDNWFVERSYKNRSMTIKDHAQAVLSQDYGFEFIPIYGDPSGEQWELEFRQHGVNIQSANKEIGQGMRGWVEYTVEVINQRLKPIIGHTIRLPGGRTIENAPKLFVLDTLENRPLVSEIEHLSWRETSAGVTVPILDEALDPNGHSDLVACLRYFAVSYKKQPNTVLPRQWDDKVWKIGR